MPLSEIKAEDAVLIFTKWHTGETTILCSGAFFGCSFNLVATVFSVGEDFVEFRATDPRCNLVLRLDVADCAFWYVEPKDLPLDVPEYAKSSSAVPVALPFRVSPSEFEADIVPAREKLIFFELREG